MTNNLISFTTRQEQTEWIEKTYQAWKAGEIRSDEALQYLCDIVGPNDDELKALKKANDKARAYLSEVVNYLGGKAELENFGTMQITNASITYDYDKKLVDQLTNQLRTEGLGDIASRLDGCLKPSERSGSLRITRIKPEEKRG